MRLGEYIRYMKRIYKLANKVEKILIDERIEAVQRMQDYINNNLYNEINMAELSEFLDILHGTHIEFL